MSALNRVLTRLHGVRRHGERYMAKCPAHDDGRASLSIAEGRDGRILLHDFSGCTFAAICAALKLGAAALFPDGERPTYTKPPRRPTAQVIQAALQRESKRYRRERNIAESGLLVSETNAVRARVARVYDVALSPLPDPLHEGGGYGGRDRDPLWPVVLEWAWEQTWIERVGEKPLSLARYAELRLIRAPRFFVEAENRAGAVMRTLERVSRSMAQALRRAT